MILTSLCYLKSDDNMYLMLYRNKKKNDPNAGKWIGIGGKFEKNESPDECMMREVYEETGLQILEYQYRGIVTFVSNLWETEQMHLFTATKWSGEMHSCNEGELQWVSVEDVERLKLWEGDKVFLKLIKKEEPFFSLKLCYQGDDLVSCILNGKIISK